MQELVVESLVVSLAMVVFYVLVDETTQMPLAERDHACETLLFDRPDEPLGIGVEIGTLRRQPNRLHTGALQDLAKDPRVGLEFRIRSLNRGLGHHGVAPEF